MKIFDLIVIGSGAGLIVANGVAEAGLTTAIIEQGPLGGTCLNRGCIPSKIVIHSADVAEEIRNAKRFGLTAVLEKVDFPFVTGRASKLVDKDARGIEQGLQGGRNPELYQGKAEFIAYSTLKVQGRDGHGIVLKGKNIVIAAGARPMIPAIPGLEKVPYLTSTEALRQTKLPKSMIILGGGYIGCELGHFYGALGCKITVIQRNQYLLPREDEEVSEAFTRIWKEKYKVITDAEVLEVQEKGDGVVVKGKAGKKMFTISAEKILVATGITPNSDHLQVLKTGVKTDGRGYIATDRYLETTRKGIWALGDIAGKYLFRHSANLEAEYVLNSILGKKKAVDYHPMPHAIFTSPQVAGVGLTEQECREQGRSYLVGKEMYKDTGMGIALAENEGFCKFLVDRKSKEILGCHILGPQASIALHEVCVAMKANRKKALQILRETVHVHPALSEVVQRAALNVSILP